jgi:methionyl-tRNA formyltransferase
MQIVVFGTADFGVTTLEALDGSHEVVAVVTGQDKPCGRGRTSAPTPIRCVAEALGIPVLTPERLDDPDFLAELTEIAADLFFVVAFRILPPSVFTLPTYGTVNLHSSLLPDYRGAAPINWAVINGDTASGLTTFYIEETVDTGDIILSERMTIGEDETAGDLFDRMTVVGAELALRTVNMIEDGTVHRTPQPTGGGRPAPKLFRSDALIDWTPDARTVHNRIRGLSPIPGAYVKAASGPFKILRTSLEDADGTGTPGVIASSDPNEGFSVFCGSGTVRVLEVQPPGKRPMSAAAYVCGRTVTPGMPVTALSEKKDSRGDHC